MTPGRTPCSKCPGRCIETRDTGSFFFQETEGLFFCTETRDRGSFFFLYRSHLAVRLVTDAQAAVHCSLPRDVAHLLVHVQGRGVNLRNLWRAQVLSLLLSFLALLVQKYKY
jgi:hypothetical protein